MKSLTVCVEYDDFLSITLPINKNHFDRTLVVTSSKDRNTQRIARDNECELFITDVFYENETPFNKGAAVEKAFDVLGRDGWFCVWDPDIVMPKNISLPFEDTSCLYGALRRTLDDYGVYKDDLDWNEVPISGLDHEFPGYFQIFHSDGAGKVPWYGTKWKHAGGCDSDFQDKFSKDKLIRLGYNVLHLGPTIEEKKTDRIGGNWYGRTSPRIDGRPIPDDLIKDRECKFQKAVEDRRKYGVKHERL